MRMIDMGRIEVHNKLLFIARGADCHSFRSEEARRAADEMIRDAMSLVNLPDIEITAHIEQGHCGVYMITGIQNCDDVAALYDAFVSTGCATPHPDRKEGFVNSVVEDLKLDTGSRPGI